VEAPRAVEVLQAVEVPRAAVDRVVIQAQPGAPAIALPLVVKVEVLVLVPVLVQVQAGALLHPVVKVVVVEVAVDPVAVHLEVRVGPRLEARVGLRLEAGAIAVAEAAQAAPAPVEAEVAVVALPVDQEVEVAAAVVAAMEEGPLQAVHPAARLEAVIAGAARAAVAIRVLVRLRAGRYFTTLLRFLTSASKSFAHSLRFS